MTTRSRVTVLLALASLLSFSALAPADAREAAPPTGLVAIANGVVYSFEDESVIATTDQFLESMAAYPGVNMESLRSAIARSDARSAFRLTPDQANEASITAPGCSGLAGDEYRTIRTWERRAIGAVPAGISRLYCGDDRWGWLHVWNDHGGDYENLIVATGGPASALQSFMLNFVMPQTSTWPGGGVYQARNDTYLMSTYIELWNSEGIARSFTNYMPVSRTESKVITSHPSTA